MSDDLWLNDKEILLWARYDLWRLKDAIMLIHGMKPNTEKGWSRPTGFDGEAGYDDIMRMAKSANTAGRLTFQGDSKDSKAWVSPAEFIGWAKAKMLNVNADLERAVAAFRQTSKGEPTVVAEQAKIEAQEESIDEKPLPKNWMLLIQAEAARLFEGWRAMGSKPTKNAIKGDLAKWCKENNVKTDGGIFPDEEYIYRHVLRKWTPP